MDLNETSVEESLHLQLINFQLSQSKMANTAKQRKQT